jgi:hypothetical protein
LIGRGKHPNHLHSKGRGQRTRQGTRLEEREKTKYGYENGKDKEPVPSQIGHAPGSDCQSYDEIKNKQRPEYRAKNQQERTYTIDKLRDNDDKPHEAKEQHRPFEVSSERLEKSLLDDNVVFVVSHLGTIYRLNFRTL